MRTFECPKCGAPVTYDPNVATSAHCSYCQSQLAVPNELRGEPARVISQIDINIGPQMAASASKAIWFVVLAMKPEGNLGRARYELGKAELSLAHEFATM